MRRKLFITAAVAAALTIPSLANATDYLKNVDALMKEPEGGFRKGDIRITTKDKKHILYIPRDITRAKDCYEFRDFTSQVSTIPGFSDASNAACPWEKQLTGAVGNFTINGVKFRVPREYLWVGRQTPDGAVEDLALMFRWPEMDAGSTVDSPSSTISILLKPEGQSALEDATGTPISKSLLSYATTAGIIKTIESGSDKQPLYVTDAYGLKYFKLPHAGDPKTVQFDYFIQGDPFKPEYWVRCELLRCHSSVDINNAVFAEYSFGQNKMNGQKHFEVRKKLVDKLQSFIVNK